MKLKFLCFFLALLPSFLHAQDVAWYIDKPIRDIQIVGLKEIKIREIRPIFEKFIGQLFTEESFLLLQSRLYALDYFEEIIPRAEPYQESEDEVVIVFEVVERSVIDAIEIKGNKKIGTGEITNVITLKRGSFFSESTLRADEAAILSLYISKGFPDASVDSELSEEEEPRLVFSINEGYERRIEKIHFYGNESFSERKLKQVIKSKETALFSKGEYSKSNIEEDQALLVQFYYENGYMDATVFDRTIDVRQDAKKQREYLTISYYLEEGAQFLFDSVEVEGNTLFSDEVLLSGISLEKGDVFNALSFEKWIQEIRDIYGQSGYVFNEFSVEEAREGGYLSFLITITERARAHIDNITISGYGKSKLHIIEREISLETGDIFDAAALRQAYYNLASLQYYSAVDITTPAGSAEGLLDINVVVEETSTTNLQFGLAFGGGSDFPVSALISWSDRNFLGRGITASISANLSPISQELDLSVSSNWLFGLRWSSRLSFFFNHSTESSVLDDSLSPYGINDPYTGAYVFSKDDTEYQGQTFSAGDFFPGIPTADDVEDYELLRDYEYDELNGIYDGSLMTYETYSLGLSYGTGYRFNTPIGFITPRASLGVYFDYVEYNPLLYRPANEQTRENLRVWDPVTRFSLGVSFDYRDIRYSPTQGYFLDQNFSFYGGILFGSRHFIRSDTKLNVYIPLVNIPVSDTWSWKLILAMETSFSIILPQLYYPGDTSYASDGPSDSDLLVLDGVFNARGWPIQRDGEAVWNSWIELRMPLAEQVIWFDAFFEAATLWEDRALLPQLSIQDMRFSMGAGIRFVIPQFPIRLYFGKRFLVDGAGNVVWQRGNAFASSDSPSSGVDFIFSISLDILQ